ncbi:MAG: glycine--tRNA ligase subunit beta, partial [Thermodesulfobacteriota bacterium]
MDRLLIEIGTEEIPAGYIEPALTALRSRLMEKLDGARIGHGAAAVYGTPRRLALMVEDVADRQTAVTTEMMGPPERVAFDENAKPTKAAEKFAEKAGVSVNRLQIKDTEKGRYLFVEKTDRGQATSTVLKQVLPEVILGLPFAKTMRWGDLRIAFARPVHSVVALYGKKVIGFPVGDVKSGRQTFGHRFLQPGRIKLDHPDQYLDALRRAWVIADIDERQSMMQSGMQRAVEAVSGHILPDDELVKIVTHLVEYPEVVRGGFDEKFLQLPREILVTAMREHQRYFAVVDDANEMMPYFVAVSNNCARDMAVVAAGNERVLKARLEDARFFYNNDVKVSLDACVEKLKSVVFQAELGSVYDKVERVRKLAAIIADRLSLGETERRHIDRAAWLCKADLVSQVVDEFPKLQGVMGRIYARVAGEAGPVARAIEEHYRPTYSGGPLPGTTTGAVLSIAEKLDTLCGCFYIGLIPTGASDPYALRRQGIGLIQIARQNGFAVSLSECIFSGMANFGDPDTEKARQSIDAAYEFLQNRMAHLLEEEGISKDLVAAVLAV